MDISALKKNPPFNGNGYFYIKKTLFMGMTFPQNGGTKYGFVPHISPSFFPCAVEISYLHTKVFGNLHFFRLASFQIIKC
jgi:hypothetical protein